MLDSPHRRSQDLRRQVDRRMIISPCKSYLSSITVQQNRVTRTTGRVIIGSSTFVCALGRNGLTKMKREGDGGTPRGRFRLHTLWWRDDRMPRPRTGLKTARIRPEHGWCDDIRSGRYNRLIKRPFSFSHEIMRREDHLYDCVIEIGWNLTHVKRGAGSAIFFHLAAPNFTPTAGCVAVAPAIMRKFLRRIGPKTTINIM